MTSKLGSPGDFWFSLLVGVVSWITFQERFPLSREKVHFPPPPMLDLAMPLADAPWRVRRPSHCIGVGLGPRVGQ